MRFIQSLKLAGLLSFPPDMEPFELESLNVLIGPNGSGKSNFIEAFELLRALPADFAKPLREGGGISEWLWKGQAAVDIAQIELKTGTGFPIPVSVRYRIDFGESAGRVVVLDELLENSVPGLNMDEPFVYFRNGGAQAVIRVENRDAGTSSIYPIEDEHLTRGQSLFAQRRDASLYPVPTLLGRFLFDMQTFRRWTFGPRSEVRRPQQTDLPDNPLLPDSGNLALAVNYIEQFGKEWDRFNSLLKRFFPRFERMTTRVSGGAIQFYLYETGFDTPTPVTRMSDGTLRFIAMLAVLLSPDPPPLVCIEEPELGLHPDAVALMGDVLEEASERMQLVVTTHSDALVSELTNRPSAIVACERPGAGTMLRRLDPEHVAHWLDEYALGDIWRMGALGANP